MKFVRFRFCLLFYVLIPGGFFSLLAILVCDRWVERASEGQHSSELTAVQGKRVAIVLGCSERLRDGRMNLYFLTRINAAVELYEASKCQWIIVSGDNGTEHYNEPERMKAALVSRGIPEEKVICDFAGFRTLDSIARARSVFMLTEVVIVSQAFHNKRALFLAGHFGLDAVGYDAEPVSFAGGLRTRLREKLARVNTVMDVYLLGTEPRFYGDPLPVGPTR